MIRAVLDTNVLASGFVRPEPPPGQLLLAWQAGLFELLTSDRILEELARTFERRYFTSVLSPLHRAANMALIRYEATIVVPTVALSGVASHPEDDLILAVAVSSAADYLVSGDRELNDLGRYEGVLIVNPRRFLEVLLYEADPGI